MRSSKVCPSSPLPDNFRRQEWLSARAVAFLIAHLFWLSVARFLFHLLYSSIRLESQCVHLSQAQPRGFRRCWVHWGSSVTMHWLLARGSDLYGSTSYDSGSIFPAGPGSSLCHVLLAHWGGLFYWSWQVTVHSFDLGVFSRFCVWLGASSFSHPPRKKNQVCHISLKTLQCYSGKVISLSLAILGCKLYVPEVFKSTSCHSGSSQGRNSSLETQGQSVGLGEKAGRKFSSTDKRAPGYQLSPNYFQEFRQMPAPDWAQKMLCIIVPNRSFSLTWPIPWLPWLRHHIGVPQW